MSQSNAPLNSENSTPKVLLGLTSDRPPLLLHGNYATWLEEQMTFMKNQDEQFFNIMKFGNERIPGMANYNINNTLAIQHNTVKSPFPYPLLFLLSRSPYYRKDDPRGLHTKPKRYGDLWVSILKDVQKPTKLLQPRLWSSSNGQAAWAYGSIYYLCLFQISEEIKISFGKHQQERYTLLWYTY